MALSLFDGDERKHTDECAAGRLGLSRPDMFVRFDRWESAERAPADGGV